jgi:hypothetical protein
MSLPDTFIVMLKQALPPEIDWFTDLNVLVDLGYLGIKSDYRGDQIALTFPLDAIGEH